MRSTPMLSLEHHLRGGRPGEERDLRVPVLDGQRRAVLQRPAGSVSHDLLLGGVERDTTAGPFLVLAEQADLAQQHVRVLAAATVERRLHRDIVESGAAAHPGAAYVGPRQRAVLGEVETPHDGGSVLPLEERGRTLREDLRVERYPDVRAIDRLAACVRFRVQCSARADEGADVGDRIVDAIAVRPPLQIHGLVEVHRPQRIDRDEWEVCEVGVRHRRSRCCRLGLLERLGAEVARRMQLHPYLGEGRGQ